MEVYRRNPNRVGDDQGPRRWTWERRLAFWRRADRIADRLESLSPTGRALMDALAEARQAVLLELLAAGVDPERAQVLMAALHKARGCPVVRRN